MNTNPSKPRWKAWAREPLLHFAMIGLALSAASTVWSHFNDTRRIVLMPEHVSQLANTYALQFGRQPDARTLEELVAREARDEVLYREGRALGLDKDDLVVRRRIIQKMQFFTEGLNPPAEPSGAQLQAYFEANRQRYAEPARVTFSHIFFSAASGEAAARDRAGTVLAELDHASARAPERGDPFPDAYDYAALDAEQLRRLFGETPVVAALREQAPGRWMGPVQSAYGWHLVRVGARSAPQSTQLAQVRERVRTDYLLDAQAALNRTAFDRLASQYTVVREKAAP